MEVPDETSVITKEANCPEKVINFAPELIPFIQSGIKTVTYRLGTKYSYLKVGDKVEIREYGSVGLVAKAEIIFIEELPFEELPLRYPGHESYENKEHQRRVFNGYYYYTGRQIADKDSFLLIEFDLVNPAYTSD
ncbi:MAG: ASCH domain-containing protein [Bdellovibrionales bacterium]|nr:ASCH domain-containing protein [Bdellovibrionales bacterium]